MISQQQSIYRLFKIMSFFTNLILTSITIGIVFLVSFLLPQKPLVKLDYKPQCLQMYKTNQKLCVYCELSNDQTYKGQKPSRVITNIQPLKVLGVKANSSLRCSDYLQLVDYTSVFLSNAHQIQFQSTAETEQIFHQTQVQQIIQFQTNNGNELLIDKNQYKSFVVYEINESPSMNMIVHQLQQDSFNPTLSLILSVSGIITLFFIVYLDYGLPNSLNFNLLINAVILFLVMLISREKQYPTIDNYQYPAALFFVLCLLKINTNFITSLSMLFAMMLGYYLGSEVIIMISYLLCWFLFLWKGSGELRYNKIYYYIGLSMPIYICAHLYRVTRNLGDIYCYQQLKMIQIVILTISTTLVQALTENIIEQFVEYKDITKQYNQYNQYNPSIQGGFQQIEELENDNLQDDN